MSALRSAFRWFLGVLPLLLGAVLFGAGLAEEPTTGVLFLAAFAFTWWLVPFVAAVARRVGAVALPGGRAVNLQAQPLLGGGAIYLPLALTLAALAAGGDLKALGLGAGATLMFLLGAADDVFGVRPRWKILVQLLAGGCLVAAGFRLPDLSIPNFHTLDLGVLEVPAILFWIVLATNAFNLTDGMDGLASSMAFLAAMGCVIVGAMPVVGVVVAGASLGFLRHNLPPARIFLGDSGSLTLGFTLAALVLAVPSGRNIPLMLAILAYPLGDMTLAVLRRFVRGKPLFAGDRGHVHHKLMRHLGSVRLTLIVLVLFAAGLMALGLLRPGRLSVITTLAAWGALGIGLVWAAQFRFRRAFSYRRPLRYLYVVRNYVSGGLKLAQSTDDVARLLRHMAEALGLSLVEIRGIRVPPADVPDEGQEHTVVTKRGSGRWSAVAMPEHGILEEERQTIVTDLLRDACSRLAALNGEGAYARVEPRPDDTAVKLEAGTTTDV